MATPRCRYSDMAEANVVQARCLHCRTLLIYSPSAGKITLFTNTAMIFEFFCTDCYSYNRQRIINIEVAKGLSDAGVPTIVVHVPMEVMERDELGEIIGEPDCVLVEGASLAHFNQVAQRELANG